MLLRLISRGKDTFQDTLQHVGGTIETLSLSLWNKYFNNDTRLINHGNKIIKLRKRVYFSRIELIANHNMVVSI